MQIFAGTKRQNEKNEAPKRKSKTKPRNKKSETNKALQRTKKAPRPTSRGAFLLKDFIAFPSVWRGGKNVEINTLGS